MLHNSREYLLLVVRGGPFDIWEKFGKKLFLKIPFLSESLHETCIYTPINDQISIALIGFSLHRGIKLNFSHKILFMFIRLVSLMRNMPPCPAIQIGSRE